MSKMDTTLFSGLNSEYEKQKTSDIIGISSVVVQDFKAKRNKNYQFSWDRMIETDGLTGIYLQYAHARLSRSNNR